MMKRVDGKLRSFIYLVVAIFVFFISFIWVLEFEIQERSMNRDLGTEIREVGNGKWDFGSCSLGNKVLKYDSSL